MDSLFLFLVLRVAVSLAVLGLLWYLQRRFAGRLGVRPRADVSVCSRTPLGAKSQAVVLEAHRRRYLLGVTVHGVNVLDGDLPPAPGAKPAMVPEANLVETPEELRPPVALPWMGDLQKRGEGRCEPGSLGGAGPPGRPVAAGRPADDALRGAKLLSRATALEGVCTYGVLCTENLPR